MKTYKAKKNDLNIKIETLSGDTVELTCTLKQDAKAISTTFSKFKKLEEGLDGSVPALYKVKAEELAMVYDQKAEWFLENLTPSLVSEILTDLVKGLLGSAQGKTK